MTAPSISTLAPAVALALALVAPRVVHAQAANAEADGLFREGRDLMATGKFAEACSAFEASERLDPAITTLLNLADCREKNGQLATAWAVFLDAERRARAGTEPASVKLRQVASDHAAKLEPRLSKLEIAVPASPPDGLRVVRDREVVDPSVWNHSVPIDGGTYTIVASAPGFETWTGSAVVAVEGDTRRVDVPPLRPAARTLPAAHGTTTTQVPPSPTSSRSHAPSSSMHRVGLGLMIAGGASIVTGLAFGASAISTWHDATGVCGASLECDTGAELTRAHSLAATAHDRGNVATGFVAGGAAVAAGGLVLWWVTRHGGEGAHAVAIAPTLGGPRAAGIEVHARF